MNDQPLLSVAFIVSFGYRRSAAATSAVPVAAASPTTEKEQ